MNVKVGLKESWMPKNWCFWNVVLEKTLESLLDCKEIQPVHPKEISPECSLKGLMLKLKGQYFGHLMWRADSVAQSWPWCCEKLRAGGEGDDRGWDGWMASLTRWTWVWVDSDGLGGLACYSSWGCKASDTTERLNWTEYSTEWSHSDVTVCSVSECVLGTCYIPDTVLCAEWWSKNAEISSLTEITF